VEKSGSATVYLVRSRTHQNRRGTKRKIEFGLYEQKLCQTRKRKNCEGRYGWNEHFSEKASTAGSDLSIEKKNPLKGDGAGERKGGERKGMVREIFTL